MGRLSSFENAIDERRADSVFISKHGSTRLRYMYRVLTHDIVQYVSTGTIEPDQLVRARLRLGAFTVMTTLYW
jgi:hypothetical protein